MFQVSNKSTQKSYELGSKFKIKNIPENTKFGVFTVNY